MEDSIIKDEGMNIVQFIAFFIIFKLVMEIPVAFVSILLGMVNEKAIYDGACIVELITYIIFIKKLKKDYFLNLKLKFNLDKKVYIFIIITWIGYRLTYDNSLGVLIMRLSSDSWIHEALKDNLEFSNLFLLSVFFVAPIFEEIICRGYVLDRLSKKYSKNTAIILSALFFSIMHMNLIQGVNTFFLGLILGVIYIRTNSLIPCIVLHFVNNFFSGITMIGGFSYIKLAVGICILIMCGYMYFKERKSNNFFIEL